MRYEWTPPPPLSQEPCFVEQADVATGLALERHRFSEQAASLEILRLAARVRELEGENRWLGGILQQDERVREMRSLKARIAALEAENAALRWQPIATAPKDGRWILLGWFLEHGGGGRPDVAFWRSDTERWSSGDRDLKAAGYFSPTHWMPLPARPATPAASLGS